MTAALCITFGLSPLAAVGVLVGITLLVALLWFLGWAWMASQR